MSDAPGLRARKRLSAMRRLQEVAFDLFERHGFDAVTIERIAEEAEVSPSSVYRYFGTKEQLVLWDEYDPAAFGRFAAELEQHPPLAAMRRAVAMVGDEFFGRDRVRIERMTRFAFEEPAIATAVAAQLDEAAQAIAQLVAATLGRGSGDLEVQVFARAVVAAIESALRAWYEQDFEPSLADLLDRALDVLEGGLAVSGRPWA